MIIDLKVSTKIRLFSSACDTLMVEQIPFYCSIRTRALPKNNLRLLMCWSSSKLTERGKQDEHGTTRITFIGTTGHKVEIRDVLGQPSVAWSRSYCGRIGLRARIHHGNKCNRCRKSQF